MRSIISRWFMFGLLLGGAISHATVFAQGTGTTSSPPQPGFAQPAQPPTVKVANMTIDKLRTGLDKTISIDFTGQSLQDVVNHLRDRTGLAINIDQMAALQMGFNGDGAPMAQVEVKARNEKAGSILRRLLNTHRLSYVLLEDCVLVTTEEMALLRQMRQRVNVDVEEIPFKKAVRELARNHGINLVIDPTVSKLSDSPISLQVDNTGIETAIRLLAELANLKAVRMGNVMFITNETKAKKIREEEPHQFDNPLNPNIPGGVPPIAIGGFGGIGGAFRGGGVQGNPGIATPDGPVPVPPPGIDLPKAVPSPDAPVQAPAVKKVIDIRNPAPLPPIPGAAPAVESPPQPALPIQRNR